MSEKFKNKYRIESARWQNWDYSNNGLYFITCCTQNHECLFGYILNKQIHYNAIGDIVLDEWNKSFDIRNELFCDAFVIMPNHIHAILRIDNFDLGKIVNGGIGDCRVDGFNGGFDVVETHGCASQSTNPSLGYFKTHCRASLHTNQPSTTNHGVAIRQPKSISSFMAGYKSAVTKRVRNLGLMPPIFKKSFWQTRFHDHVIRNEQEYYRIKNYIEKNIERWEQDKFFK